MPLLLALAALGAVAALFFEPIYLDRLRRELSRADEMARIAQGLGLQYSSADPAYPGSTAFRYPFELFSRGVEQTCENFISGRIGGVDVVAFDFLYRQRVDSDGEPDNDMLSESIRYSCALAAVDGQRPHVVARVRTAGRSSGRGAGAA